VFAQKLTVRRFGACQKASFLFGKHIVAHIFRTRSTNLRFSPITSVCIVRSGIDSAVVG
jgi:hypothetical protein